jgi:alkyl hydroperoxide reductase subunit AhpF
VQGVFVEVGLSPNTGFLGELVRLNEIGEIQVDCASQVELPGLFAAGDVTSVPEKQIIIAAGDGAKAALGAYSFLVRSPEVIDWGQSPPRRSEKWETTPNRSEAHGTDDLLGPI